MAYIAPFDSPRLRHAYERPALCALEAAALAAQHALRHRFPPTLDRTDGSPPPYSRILALILIDRLGELLATIDLYEQQIAHEPSHTDPRRP
jgi:hypothetical protein